MDRLLIPRLRSPRASSGQAGQARGSDGRLAAADELDDFEVVVVAEECIGPAVALDDAAVELDGDAVLFQVEEQEEGLEAGLRGDLSRLSVN